MEVTTLHWIPLGAGSSVVPHCGRAYEAVCAVREHRTRRQLVHAALTVEQDGLVHTVEQAPAWADRHTDRGVRMTGPVGLRWLGRFRLFRYEIRCWPGGTIPDLDRALAHTEIPSDPTRTSALIELAGEVPMHTWGRDEIGVGDMWNSNSVIAWLLVRSGHDLTSLRPPAGCRAPGWRAGLVAADGDEGPRPGWSRPHP